MRTIRASEIGSFLYCRRAWWYQKQGVASDNQAELVEGTGFHHRHGGEVLMASLLRMAGWVLLFFGVISLAVGLTALLLQ